MARATGREASRRAGSAGARAPPGLRRTALGKGPAHTREAYRPQRRRCPCSRRASSRRGRAGPQRCPPSFAWAVATGGAMTTVTPEQPDAPLPPVRPEEGRGRSGDFQSWREGRARSSTAGPAVGLAVGVVRDGRLEFFHGHGLADIALEDADHRGHGVPHRLDHQDLHGDRGDAAVGAGTGRPRAPGQRLSARLPAHPHQGRLAPGDRAPPAHPHGRDPRGRASSRPAPRRLEPV